jgi:hypothetical protein
MRWHRETLSEEQERRWNWTPKFAWFPVRCVKIDTYGNEEYDGHAWLEKVFRRSMRINTFKGYYWQHTYTYYNETTRD